MEFAPEYANRWLFGGNYPRAAGNRNPYNELLVRVVYKEEGSALSGRDVRCLDDVYRRCQSISLPGDCDPSAWKTRFMAQHDDVYDVHFFGPYSTTSGT